jgi:3-dehydroquinate synthetase
VLLERLSLPVDVKARLSPEVLARIEVDKKRRTHAVRFVLVPAPGQAVLCDIPLGELKAQVIAAL